MEDNENNIGCYSVIPTRILFNENLKPNVKLLYGAITSLCNKEGYCFASNNYLGAKFKVDPKTISSWIKELRELNYVIVEIIRNDKKEIIQRRIYVNDTPYTLNNRYPYTLNNVEPIHQKIEENNIITNNINTHTEHKKTYNKNVYLYEYEYDSLVEEYGIDKANKCIEELSLYKNSKGVQYVSDYDTIKRWVILRVNELEKRNQK
ncbi:MAG: helix-turn-helix domain-containing protein, partial [Clostridiales bacterium]|nr:helix-turn-helix domain-containing protein [Clostridiales bacterium]